MGSRVGANLDQTVVVVKRILSSTDYNGGKYRESRVIWYLNDYITSDSAVKNLSVREGKKHEFAYEAISLRRRN